MSPTLPQVAPAPSTSLTIASRRLDIEDNPTTMNEARRVQLGQLHRFCVLVVKRIGTGTSC
jgi:hypothetical protein